MASPPKQRKRRRRRPKVPDLRKAMFVLPNLFTISSVFCGVYAIILTSGDPSARQMYQAALAVFFGAFFDAADGRVARLTRTQSDFGVQLDSLADAITFGVAPGIIAYKWGLSSLGFLGVFVAFTYIACGIIRLARFNVLSSRATAEESAKFFVGLPIPLAAGVVVSLVMFHQKTIAAPITHSASVASLLLILSYLMVSNVRYRSFKKLKIDRRSLTVGFAVLLVLVVFAARIEPTFALLAFFGGYVTLGLLEAVLLFNKNSDDGEETTEPHDSPHHDTKQGEAS